MNIGIVCYPTYGGSGVIATELGKSLALNGHKVHFISFDTPFRLQQYNSNIFFHEASIESYPVFKHPPATLAITIKDDRNLSQRTGRPISCTLCSSILYMRISYKKDY